MTIDHQSSSWETILSQSNTKDLDQNQSEIDTLPGKQNQVKKTTGIDTLLRNIHVSQEHFPMLDLVFERLIPQFTRTLRNHEFFSWEPESQFILSAKPDSQISICCDETDIWQANIGQRSGNVSVGITESYIKEKEGENYGYGY